MPAAEPRGLLAAIFGGGGEREEALEDALAAKHAEAAALRSQLDHLSGALARQRTPHALGAQRGMTASPLGAPGFGR